MYRPRVPEKNISDMYENDTAYRCITDVYCKDGVFEKGSVVMIEPAYINPYTGLETKKHMQEYIRLRDFGDYICDNNGYDIPIGVSALNFEGVFKAEPQLTDRYNEIYDDYTSDLQIGRIIRTISSALFVFAFIIAGLSGMLFLALALFSNPHSFETIRKCAFLGIIIASLLLVISIAGNIVKTVFCRKADKKWEQAKKELIIECEGNTENEEDDNIWNTAEEEKSV